jgi:PAS domain S-box-containing protein
LNQAAPTLEDLRGSLHPAWLWDPARARVVWGNSAGIAYFGGETLFDLLDRPFDPIEAGVGEIVALAPLLRRGERRKRILHFPSSGDSAPLTCDCSLHALPDGRPGVLVAANKSEGSEEAGPQDLAVGFDLLPVPAILLDDARIAHVNEAAAKLFTEAQRGSLAVLLGDAKAAQDLLARLEAGAMFSLTRRLATAYGERDIRLTGRIAGKDGLAVLLFDDVTERRIIERSLLPSLADSLPRAAETAKPSLTPEESEVFAALGKALRPAPPHPAKAPEHKAPAQLPALPLAVTAKIDSLPEATIIVQNNVLQYANQKALALLKYRDLAGLMEAEVLLPALDVKEGSRGEAEIACGDGSARRLAIVTTSIAWRNGPAVQITLGRPAHEPKPPVPAKEAEAVTEKLPKVKAEKEQAKPAAKQAQEGRSSRSEVDYEELRAILDTTADGIITLDSEGRIYSLSAGAEAIFGYRIAEVADKPLAELLAPESRKVLRDYLAALQGPGLAAVFNDGREVTAIVKQGGTVPVFLTIGRLQKARPEGAAFCAVVRDITQWKRTEAELREAKDAAEQASRQKSEFLAKISHELRTPLNAILGFSEVMRLERFGEIRNDKYRGYVNDIHASGAHLLSLINDLLDLSKVEAGKLELNFTSVNLGDVLDHCLKLMQEHATSARVILRKNIPANLPNVVADLRSMRQIMLNLLSNAIKFTDPGGQVIVSAHVTPVGELKLRVKDTGLGMSEAEMKDALEPFRRVTTEGRDAPGTGLGLPLTKALAEANRASFVISSEPRKGTLVEITFPTTRVLAE